MDYLNVIIDSDRVRDGDRAMLFPDDEDVRVCSGVDMYDLLVMVGVFKSKGDARKNWHGVRDIPGGWSEYKVGKLKKELCVWNPAR